MRKEAFQKRYLLVCFSSLERNSVNKAEEDADLFNHYETYSGLSGADGPRNDF